MDTLLKYCFLFLSAFALSTLRAQPAVIRGNLADGGSQVVRVLYEPNPFTQQLEVIATDTCDARGNFSFNLHPAGPVHICLDVWCQNDWFWIEPGDTIDVIAPDPLPGGFSPVRGSAGFYRLTTDTLSTAYLIDRFDESLATFLDSSFTTIFRKGNIALARKYIARETRVAKDTKNQFAASYIQYSLWLFALDSRAETTKAVTSRIFAGRPDYSNPAFMTLVSRIFEDYHLKSTQLNHKEIIDKASKGEYRRFLDLLGQDSLLKNEIVRELAAIRVVTGIVNSLPPTKRQGALNLLDSMAFLSKFPEHRHLAQQIKNQSGTLIPLSPAPQILSTDTAFPDSLYGKPAVIMFLHTQCPGCLEAANWLAAFKQREHWNGRVVTIFMDRSEQAFQTYTNQQTWPWTSIWGGNDVNMAHRWQIKSLPLTVLIDRNGKIFQFPAPEPGVDSEKLLQKLAEIKPGDRRRR